MKIADVSVSVHRFETTLPVVDRPGPAETRVICTITSDEGHRGTGMTARFLPAGVAASIRHHLARAIIGLDPTRPAAVIERLMPIVSERGITTGVNRAALSCIDLALWDLTGHALGRRVSDLFGGLADDAPAYITCGFPNLDRDEQAALAKAMVAEGYGTIKMVVGHKGGLAEDVARIKAIRAAVGEGVGIAIDANERFSYDTALRLCQMLEGEPIAWFEDPVFNNDARDLARLRAATGIALGAGQMDGHARRFREFAEADALDIFMPNPMYNGGMSETQRVAALANVNERPLSDAGGGGIYCLHHMTAFPGATLAEVHLGTLHLETQLYAQPPRVRNGRSALPDAPGFGMAIDAGVLGETRLDL
ncbi:MAG: mandelate racemase/muconate lactonizing enzyme family protein [Acuticoccus sp.]